MCKWYKLTGLVNTKNDKITIQYHFCNLKCYEGKRQHTQWSGGSQKESNRTHKMWFLYNLLPKISEGFTSATGTGQAKIYGKDIFKKQQSCDCRV